MSLRSTAWPECNFLASTLASESARLSRLSPKQKKWKSKKTHTSKTAAPNDRKHAACKDTEGRGGPFDDHGGFKRKVRCQPNQDKNADAYAAGGGSIRRKRARVRTGERKRGEPRGEREGRTGRGCG